MDAGRMASLERPVFEAQTADDLRELITQAELTVANLRGAGARAQTLLFLLDTIEKLFASLPDRGVDLRAEATRIETVHRLLLANDSMLVHQMRRVGGLARAREQVKPAPGQWWWYLDLRVAERHQRQLRRVVLIAAGALAALLVAGLVVNKLFPPDPRRIAAMDKTSQAERALQEGDVAKALEYYRQAAQIMPEDADLQLWVGVLEEKQGQPEAAAQAYAQAEQLAGDRAHFLMQRGMIRVQAGDIEQAKADGDAALALNPDLAEAYFLLGNVYEAQGDALNAIAAFEKTADLAAESNNSALIVMAKTRLGMLLQAAPAMSTREATPSPDGSS